MPITQDRLKSLIDAGTELTNTWLFLASQATESIVAVRNGQLTPTQALDQIELLCLRPDLAIALPKGVIELERIRWHYSHKRNTSEKLRLQRKRQGMPSKRKDVAARAAAGLSTMPEVPDPQDNIIAGKLRPAFSSNVAATSAVATARLDRANAAMDAGGDEMSFGADTTAEVVAPTPTIPDDEMAKLLAIHEKDTYGETYGAGAGAKPKTEQE